MPTRSPGPAGSIRDLQLPGRAVTALTRAGITDVAGLATLTREDLEAIGGLGPAMITAIRRVVPEPGASRAGSPRAAGARVRTGPAGPGADEPDEPRESPVIPSVESLRGPRRRSAVDLLVPGPPTGPAAPVTEPAPATGPATSAAGPRTTGPTAGGPRPAEWSDLAHLGARGARALLGAPVRLALWSVRAPARCVRRRGDPADGAGTDGAA
ncbi:hypothetical protein OF117_08070 [Geodermatophilus sp. YIM 151500]|uniref:DNA-directed RNA polymerase subunit alpha C-terminal domain-containing protein n=1 Tax=Geodermatophilus sp. YIM 151500 TaxID=2984531 RepID=UPI0021E3A3C3|nr:DNA-directed RNA polymerase subunit alpha C-terminal domain-containing protein [Geodermatophilus sp. YIM 151500]MCV2489320.1 hypothetical protein [Geodermatophilus sp. YIM 151500]